MESSNTSANQSTVLMARLRLHFVVIIGLMVGCLISVQAQTAAAPFGTGRILHSVAAVDCQQRDGLLVDSAFLGFTDEFGRQVQVYAARCIPSQPAGKLPVVLHVPGGTQTVDAGDLIWLARHGFAAVSFDWEIRDSKGHDPKRKSRWPEGVRSQNDDINRPEQAMLPLATLAASACLDWMCDDPRIDPDRMGVVGISWGGFLSWSIAAHDSRIKAMVPVFGCSILDDPRKIGQYVAVNRDMTEAGQLPWDASVLVDRIKTPVCYVSSTDDFFGLHSVSNAILDRLESPHRRACFPNNNHHIGPGESALALAWLTHYLAEGPAVPDEPVLADDLTIVPDSPSEVVDKTLWWTPSDGPDDFRCWKQGLPTDRRVIRQAFGRVRYKSGIVLNTSLWTAKHEPVSAANSDAVWPNALDGIGFTWGLSSTQLNGMGLSIQAVQDDPTRALWKIDRPGGGALSIMFNGLADPTWNDGRFDAIEIGFDFAGEAPQQMNIVYSVLKSEGGRSEITRQVPVKRTASGWVVAADLHAASADASWKDVKRITLKGDISSNQFIVGPIRKQSSVPATGSPRDTSQK